MNFKSKFVHYTLASAMIISQASFVQAQDKTTASQSTYNSRVAARDAAQALSRKYGITINPQKGVHFIQKSRAMYGEITDTKLGVAFSYPTSVFNNLVVFSYIDSSGKMTTGSTLVVGDVVGSFSTETSPVIFVEPSQKNAIASMLKKSGFEIYVSESSSFIAIQSSDLFSISKVLAPFANSIQSVETEGQMTIPEAPQELLPVMIPKNETSLKAILALTGNIPSEVMLEKSAAFTYDARKDAKEAAEAIQKALGIKVNPTNGVNFVQNTRFMYGMVSNTKIGVAFAYPTPYFQNLVLFSFTDSSGQVTTGSTLVTGDEVGPFEPAQQLIVGVKDSKFQVVTSALKAGGIKFKASESGSYVLVESSDFVALSKVLEKVASSIEFVEIDGKVSIPEGPQEQSPIAIPKYVTSLEEVKGLVGNFPAKTLFGPNSCMKVF